MKNPPTQYRRREMPKLAEPIALKLDALLSRLCTEQVLADSSAVPVIIRCHSDSMADVTGRVSTLGGRVRHRLNRLNAVAAWIPLSAVPELARAETVATLELAQEFAVA